MAGASALYRLGVRFMHGMFASIHNLIVIFFLLLYIPYVIKGIKNCYPRLLRLEALYVCATAQPSMSLISTIHGQPFLIPLTRHLLAEWIKSVALQWRHNEHDGVSNHQRFDCLLNGLFRYRSKKISKLLVTGLCGEFPAQYTRHLVLHEFVTLTV